MVKAVEQLRNNAPQFCVAGFTKKPSTQLRQEELVQLVQSASSWQNTWLQSAPFRLATQAHLPVA